jgi:ABC-type enterobactin transport system permease subunit
MFTADTNPIMTCPVAPLAVEAGRLIRQRRLYDGKSDELMSAVDDRLEQVQEAAVRGHALSRSGLFFQTCCALAAVDLIGPTIRGEGAVEGRVDLETVKTALLGMAYALDGEDVRTLATFYLPKAANQVLAA